VPGRAPVPRHVVQAMWVATVTGTWAPSTAWSKDSETVVSRSRPRSAAGCVRVRVPPPELKMPERMSEKEPKSAAPPGPAPPPAPPNGELWENMPPRS
jgi:hypothetical protein